MRAADAAFVVGGACPGLAGVQFALLPRLTSPTGSAMVARGGGQGKGLAAAKRTGTPRRKRLNRESRLQAARRWLAAYDGRRVVKSYAKWFGVDKLCAIRELQMLGVALDPDHIRSAKALQRSRAPRKSGTDPPVPGGYGEIRDENFAFIAGFTEGGAPYGVTWGEWREDNAMREGAALRSDVARALRRAFPDGVIEQPRDEEDSPLAKLVPKLRRRLAQLAEARIAYERGTRAEPTWPEGADRSEDPPEYLEFDTSYRLIFVTGPGDRLRFEDEVETEYVPWDDEPPDAAEGERRVVRGIATAGCIVALSVIGPFALVHYGTLTSDEDGSESTPGILEPGEAARAAQHLREQLGNERWRALEALRDRLVQAVEAAGAAVLAPDEQLQRVPFLRFGDDVIPEGTVTLRTALFFQLVT
jgi:hypothetical protein